MVACVNSSKDFHTLKNMENRTLNSTLCTVLKNAKVQIVEELYQNVSAQINKNPLATVNSRC